MKIEIIIENQGVNKKVSIRQKSPDLDAFQIITNGLTDEESAKQGLNYFFDFHNGKLKD